MSRLRLQQAPSGDHIGVTGGGGWDGGWEQGDQCGGHYKSLQDTQWFSQGSWGCGEGEKWSDSGSIWNVLPSGFADGLNA